MKKTKKTYSVNDTDVVMAKTIALLASDLSTSANLEVPVYKELAQVAQRCAFQHNYGDLRRICEKLPDPWGLEDPYAFKVTYQIKNFLKRYIFRTDKYTPTELKDITNAKFREVQTELARPRKPLKLSTFLVMQHARRIVKEALGPYDPEEHAVKCRFSTKACVGFPTPESYLDTKLRGPLTGSYGHHRWFIGHLSADSILAEAYTSTSVIDALTLFNVPKSYKTLRGITPNTLIGSFHSYGLGKMLEDRLLNVGIDVSRQPQKHQAYARRNSVSRKLVTADLSSASDSFTYETVARLVPRPWLKQLNLGRLRTIIVDGTRQYQTSFMAMGIGFTFPLQTLLFYAIIRAVQVLTKTHGLISVFGDDLVYPKKIHGAVVSVLTDCGFRMNLEKTFVNAFFRESCGGDYFKSVDVRPASPEGVGQSLGKWAFLSFLHKITNSLTLRWEPECIPSVIRYLTTRAAAISTELFCIPDDLPDYSGFKRLGGSFYLPAKRPEWSQNLQCKLFFCLLETPVRRYVPTLIGYYWDALRSRENGEVCDNTVYTVQTGNLGTRISAPTRSLYGAIRETIMWVKAKSLDIKEPKNYRSRITRRRLKFLVPSVASKEQAPVIRVSQAISILAS